MILIIPEYIETKDLEKFSDKEVLRAADKAKKGLGYFLPIVLQNAKTDKVYFTSHIGAGRAVFVTKKIPENLHESRLILLMMAPKNSKWGKNMSSENKKFMTELKNRAVIAGQELLSGKFRFLDV